MNAKDLMQSHVTTIREDATIEQLCDVLQSAHVNGVPVVNEGGELVGIVSEEDVLFGAMGGAPAGPGGSGATVAEIMTSPAVCATPETDIVELCRMMWGMRIHHVPIVDGGRLLGIVSSLDLVRAVAEGTLTP